MTSNTDSKWKYIAMSKIAFTQIKVRCEQLLVMPTEPLTENRCQDCYWVDRNVKGPAGV